MAEAVRYRRLPGRRRGFFRGSSVWLGPDHLLLVKSMRFREEYKRYQFRDIQAIVFARAQRFHISTRAAWIAVLWMIAYPFLLSLTHWTHALMWSLAALLVIAWIVVSASFSCACQINTAVSRDDLPSLYRIWTVRRFLRRVEPLIVQAQGAIEGPWAEAVEERTVGPAVPPPPMFYPPVTPGMPAPPAAPVARTRSLVTDLMLAALFGDAILNAVGLNTAERWLQVATNIMTLLVLAAAIAVTVQRYRGFLRKAMQRLAIVTLAGVGLLYYIRPFIVGMMTGLQASAGKPPEPYNITTTPYTRGVEAILTFALGVAGLAIVFFFNHDGDPPPEIFPSPPA